MTKRIHILTLIFGILLSSCITDEQCRQNRYVQFIAGLYHVNINQTTNIKTTTSYSIDSLTVKGLVFDTINLKYIYSDSILYNKSKSVNKLYLPLHKFENLTKFEVKLNEQFDTLTIIHKNADYYISLECGCLKIHSIDTVLTTNHFIDSVKIINYNVNTTNVENIRIYK